MSLYVYCVMPARSMPPLTVLGIQNQIARLVEADLLHVVVSDFSGNELLPSKENIFAHERVVEHCMDYATPLPFRFGAVVAEDKIRDFIGQNSGALLRDLDRVHDCVEMNLKVMIPTEQPAVKTGTAFLQSKRRQYDLRRDVAEWLAPSVSEFVRETNAALMRGNGSAIVRLAHLVLRADLELYKSKVDSAIRQRPEWAFLRSGPWPPYSFVSTPGVG